MKVRSTLASLLFNGLVTEHRTLQGAQFFYLWMLPIKSVVRSDPF